MGGLLKGSFLGQRYGLVGKTVAQTSGPEFVPQPPVLKAGHRQTWNPEVWEADFWSLLAVSLGPGPQKDLVLKK